VSWRHVAATVLLVAGCSLEVLALIGLMGMRNAYDRLHYVGVAGFGALLVGVSIFVRESFALIGDKALVTGAALALTTPVLAHATARAARIRERGSWNAPPGSAGARRRSG